MDTRIMTEIRMKWILAITTMNINNKHTVQRYLFERYYYVIKVYNSAVDI